MGSDDFKKTINILIGGVAGIALAIMGFLLCGFGHGIILPFLLYQGPLAYLFPIAFLIAPKFSQVYLFIAVVLNGALYAFYFSKIFSKQNSLNK